MSGCGYTHVNVKIFIRLLKIAEWVHAGLHYCAGTCRNAVILCISQLCYFANLFSGWFLENTHIHTSSSLFIII